MEGAAPLPNLFARTPDSRSRDALAVDRPDEQMGREERVLDDDDIVWKRPSNRGGVEHGLDWRLIVELRQAVDEPSRAGALDIVEPRFGASPHKCLEVRSLFEQ